MSELAPDGELAPDWPARRSNPLAIASLVCGLLGCIPLISGVLAVVLGLLGLRRTRDPKVGGRGLAVAGLILGVISLAVWTLVGIGVYRIGRMAVEARAVAVRFVDDLSRGRVNSALAVSDEAFDRVSLNIIAEELKPLGTLQALDVLNARWKLVGGGLRMELDGTARFTRASPGFRMVLDYDNGVYKIKSFRVE